jgi:hypothetical protein
MRNLGHLEAIPYSIIILVDVVLIIEDPNSTPEASSQPEVEAKSDNDSHLLPGPPIDIPPNPPPPNGRNDDPYREKNYHLSQKQFVVAKITLVVLAIYTGVAAYQAFQMRRATKTAIDTLNQSTESFRVDERAWVEIEPINPILVAPASGKIGAAFRYLLYPKNVGKTVATDVQVRAVPQMTGSVQMGDDANQISSIQDKLLMMQIRGTLPDGSSTDMPIRQPMEKVLSPNTKATVPFTLNGQEPQVFSKDEWVAYLIGRIDYLDAFRVPHWRKFCFFVARGTGELWNCKEGNDEDRNPEFPPN